ncbi:S-ribosylhomocysteine lyase [Bogoriella caseilytica]|uniref:S-ribosylhomocysteine lyase n=1 Tax=Bogoriella caseilytica TaxID=56055 RepID=A0A3N2BCF4_9MICO|nr:S-ribosylhomocysteine lyase /quorum-sensing autoinducer 2 (AI-2) synthesis protein LuxS [Bogoriella caseilytica]
MPLNVESFNLDHTAVAAPYVRVADVKHLPAGDVLTKYDVRFCQPNVAHLEMPALHSLEHTFAEKVRNYSDDVVDFSPMGCQTGFYLLLSGEHPYAEVLDLVEQGLREVLAAEEVPAANETQCGWAASHDLDAAKREAATMLAGRAQWDQVMAG